MDSFASETTTSSTSDPYQGSLFTFVGVACSILLTTAIITAITVTLCLVLELRRKTVTLRLASRAVAESTGGHKHHKSKETPIAMQVISNQYSPTLVVNDSPGKVSIGEGHTVQEPSKPGGKFAAKHPIYINLEPAETNQMGPQRPIICKNNQAYIHLGPEENCSEASVDEDIIIKCKQNSAYIHLSPETEPSTTDDAA